ncbi:hypothetical protein D3C75_655170 [compost metagenome]
MLGDFARPEGRPETAGALSGNQQLVRLNGMFVNPVQTALHIIFTVIIHDKIAAILLRVIGDTIADMEIAGRVRNIGDIPFPEGVLRPIRHDSIQQGQHVKGQIRKVIAGIFSRENVGNFDRASRAGGIPANPAAGEKNNPVAAAPFFGQQIIFRAVA